MILSFVVCCLSSVVCLSFVVCQTHPLLYCYRFHHSVSHSLPASYCFHSPVFHHSLFLFYSIPLFIFILPSNLSLFTCGCHTVWHASLSIPWHTDVTSWVFRAMYTLLMLVCRVLSMYASLLMWVCRVRYICPVTHWLCINHFFHCYCDTHCPVTQSPLHTVTKPRPCPSYLLFQRHYLFSLHYHSWVTSWDPKHNLLLHTPAYPFHTQSRRHSVMNWCGICPIR